MKRLISLITGLSFIFALAACGQPETTVETEVVGAFTYMDTFKQGEQTYLEVNVSYPKFSETELGESLNQYFEDKVKAERELVAREIEPYAADYLLSLGDADKPAVLSAYEVNAYMITDNEKCISVWADVYRYTGGVHPDLSSYAYNFNREGNLMTLADLFETDDYLDEIKALVLAQIEERGERENFYEGIEEYMMEAYNETYGFLITNDGVRVFWPTYELAPYAMGMPKFDITWNELDEKLTEGWKQ